MDKEEQERWQAETYLPLVVNETHPEALYQIGITVKAY
jgi:phage terminase large subunit-like protein